MMLTLSVAVFLLILTAMLLRAKTLRFSHALLCVLLGFSLAGTGMAPAIQSGLNATAVAVSAFHP
jgi:hypothetical protein